MATATIDLLTSELALRALPGGGFCGYKGGNYRPDATAWAVLVLAAAEKGADLVESGRLRLRDDQCADGRVRVGSEHPTAFWPTALAILAWHGDKRFQREESNAVKFLLATTGKHWRKKDNDAAGHDTAIRGWPWIEDTHSWVEPTSLALVALDAAGHRENERCREARRMLLDRQLPQGGWNYGNTTVFGEELRPMPESTGMALNALVDQEERSKVEKSIVYLHKRVDTLSTPLSLGWSLLGLSAWGERPSRTRSLLQHCYERQNSLGPYETTQLALLLAALLGKRGLLSCMTSREHVQ